MLLLSLCSCAAWLALLLKIRSSLLAEYTLSLSLSLSLSHLPCPVCPASSARALVHVCDRAHAVGNEFTYVKNRCRTLAIRLAGIIAT